MALDNEVLSAVELEVRRLYAADEGKFRTHLETHFRLLTWALGIFVAVVVGAAAWIFGKDYTALRKHTEDRISSALYLAAVDGKIQDALNKRLTLQLESIDSQLQQALAGGSKRRQGVG